MHNKFKKTLSAILACLLTVGMVINPGNGFMKAHATSESEPSGISDGANLNNNTEGTGNSLDVINEGNRDLGEGDNLDNLDNLDNQDNQNNISDNQNNGSENDETNNDSSTNNGENTGENNPGDSNNNGENSGANNNTGSEGNGNTDSEAGGTTGDGGITPEPEIPAEPVAPKLPECSLEEVTTSKTDITIDIYDVADDTVVEYALLENNRVLNDNSWKTLEGTTIEITEQGNYDFYYRITNSDNLTTTSDKYVIYYDSENPSMPSIDVIEYEDREYVYIDIEADREGGSPIDCIYYRIDGGRWKVYDGRIKISVEGEYEIEAYCIDICGNESRVESEYIEVSFNILKLPEVDMITDSPSNDYIRFRLIEDNEDFEYEYKFVTHGSKVSKNTDWETCGRYIEIDEEGEWDLYIRVEYEGEYITGKVATCVIDRTAPDIDGVDKKTSYNNRLTIDVDAYDEISKGRLKYSFDGGDTWGSSSTKTFTKDTILKAGDIQVKDEAENIAESRYSYRIDIDKQTITADTRAYYMKDNMELNHVAVNQGYMVGIGNNKFAPDKEITRAQLATILNRCIDFSGYGSYYINYNDVAKNHWAYDNIINIQKYNILKTSGTAFKPDQAVTRGELAHALCQIMDINAENVRCDLKDISTSEFRNDIIKVYTAGLMVGYDVYTFGPDDVLTRAQVVAVINRIFEVPDSAAQFGKQFSDVPPTHWAFNEILKASH